MIMGLRFNEIHSNSLGLELLESSRPLLAETKDQFVEIPLMSGSYLIPDDSLKDIEVTATFYLESYRYETFNTACRRIADWLYVTTWCELIFDDDQGYYYKAKPVGLITREQITKNNGQFTVTFRCHPQMFEVMG